MKKPKASAKNRKHEAARPNQPASKPKPKQKLAKPVKPHKKAAAKPAAKPVKKTAVKPSAAAKKAPVKTPVPAKAGKPAAKVAAKPATKAPAKSKAKPVAKPSVKAPAKPVVKPAVKPVAKAAVKPVAKAAGKIEKVEKAVAEITAPKIAKIEKAEKAAKVPKVKGEAKSKDAAKAAAPLDAFPALDANVKRPAKPFFLEVKPGVERVIKRGDKSAVSQVIDLQARRKGPAAEETSDELAERIERELQSQSFLKRAPMRPQMCTKCGINAVTPRFTIDRELGYCESCAEILHLGETKEARRMEFNLAVKKEEIAPPSPDEIAAEEAEGDEEAVPDLEV